MKILDHKKLGFTYTELGAFLGTYMLLKEKVITHQSKIIDEKGYSDLPIEPDKHTFNMENAGEVRDCGSVACIGGNMAILMGMSPEEYVHGAKGKKKHLFFPPDKYAYADIPVSKSLKAMENFAATGKANWKKVLGNKYLEKDS